ncbi:hypothetical protein [sulfur-oxidizing endosymbiont of Gigantopelta aegis]|uniref:hypothetical protein n=1 Tax=sulfur-oxidizing endosymbiont of Gigantopelta aegis TaxID=2794934 RepID=UPI0018DD3C2D|nr:hypothetical protein [sulfur-oxidizing endosymbiont of Gigantopelta aegis]
MNSVWPFMDGFGMVFMLVFWFLVIMAVITVAKWFAGQFNKKCDCNQTVNNNPGNKQNEL